VSWKSPGNLLGWISGFVDTWKFFDGLQPDDDRKCRTGIAVGGANVRNVEKCRIGKA